MKKDWLSELARDLIAFGSIPFLALTIARVSVMTVYYPMQFIIGSALFLVVRLILGGDMRAGIGLILLTFTSLYYRSWLFAAFALFVYTGLVFSLFYLKRSGKEIVKGVLLGASGAGGGYLIVKALF
jgi:hypothetical protein